jgi:hypothetical protein
MTHARRLLGVAFIAAISGDIGAQGAVAEVSCSSGPYRLQLPKSYPAVRRMGQLRRERVVKTEPMETQTFTHRELRFNGLELALVTSSADPKRYAVSKAIVSTRAWRIAGPLRVGAAARSALRGLQPRELPADGEVELSGERDSIRVNLSRGRILDFEYTCDLG